MLPSIAYSVLLGLSLLLLGCSPAPSSAPSPSPTSPPSISPPSISPPSISPPSISPPSISPPSISPSSISPPSTSQIPTTGGQVLPITAHANFAGQTIQLEVAQTPEQQQMGLMFRPPLPADRGMLFPFDPPRQVRFWMENTPSPLDMVFLYQGQVKHIAANVPSCTKQPCPTYGPWTAVDQVIELRSGRAAELGLKVGDRVSIQFVKS